MVDLKDLDIDNVVLNHLKQLNCDKGTAKHKAIKKINEFSASQSSYNCMRLIFYNMTCPRVTSHPDAIGTFAGGDVVHDIIEDAFIKVGGKAKIRYNKEYLGGKIILSGEPDITFDDATIEVKSVSVFAWKYVDGGKDFKSGEVIVGTPKPSHIVQLNTYLDLLSHNYGILLYVNKENYKIKPFIVKRNEVLLTQTVGKCVMVHNRILDGILPEKVKGTECSWCSYSDLCKGNKLK